jgi:hypothetical protein
MRMALNRCARLMGGEGSAHPGGPAQGGVDRKDYALGTSRPLNERFNENGMRISDLGSLQPRNGTLTEAECEPVFRGSVAQSMPITPV